MSFARHYLREQFGGILRQILYVCIFAGVFLLYHLPLAAVLYPALLCLLLGCLFAGSSFLRAYGRHKKLMALMPLEAGALREALAQNPELPRPEEGLLLRKLCRETQLTQDKMNGAYREMMDYFTVWVHQIKTPIASMRLHLEGEDSALGRRLKSDLLHIEQYVEMVLTYFKMGADTTDYLFRTVALDTVIKENLRKFRGDFILKKIDLIYTPTGQTVISDEKWLSFVIEQILSNALKYTSAGSVTITVEAPKTLCIRDTGIGIAAEDLPRIFQKGVTGGNGRTDKRASGLGLYLCKQICDRLGHGLSATSQVDAGTTLRIDLSQHRTNTDA